MPNHDPTEFPENPCSTGECVWDNIGGKRVDWCRDCVAKLLSVLNEAQNRCCYDLNEGHSPPPSGRHRRRIAHA